MDEKEQKTGVELLKAILVEVTETRKTNAHIYNIINNNISYLINYLNINNKINNNNNIGTNNNTGDFVTANVTQVPPEEQNPWTATAGFDDPTPEFLAAKNQLERDLWALRNTHRRNHITDIDLSHLILRLHTDPSTRLTAEEIRLSVGNWLNLGIKYSAPMYPSKFWELNKRHGVPHWQFNLDKGREEEAKAKAEPSKTSFVNFDQSRKRRAS